MLVEGTVYERMLLQLCHMDPADLEAVCLNLNLAFGFVKMSLFMGSSLN